MHRRDFLRIGALGAAGVSTEALGGAPDEKPLSPAELRRHVERLERGLAHIDAVDYGLRDKVAREKRDDAALKEQVDLDTRLVRSSMRAMLVTSSLADVPVANRGDETLLALVDAHAAEADFAMSGMLDRIESMTDADYKDIQAAIRTDPGLPMRAAEMIDEEASRAGIGHRRRVHFREIASHMAWKMQHQPLALVMTEAVDKTRKAVASLAADPDKLRPPKASAQEVAKWEDVSRRVRRRYARTNRADDPPLPSTGEPALPSRDRGDGRRALRDGAIVLGSGAGAAVLSVLLLLTEGSVGVIFGLFMMTAAAGLLIAGIILLLIGAIRAGSN